MLKINKIEILPLFELYHVGIMELPAFVGPSFRKIHAISFFYNTIIYNYNLINNNL